MAVFEVKHPLVQHKLGLMRHKSISTKDFRELASEVARMLTYEATRDLEVEPHRADPRSDAGDRRQPGGDRGYAQEGGMYQYPWYFPGGGTR